jgi:hypothetical protein
LPILPVSKSQSVEYFRQYKFSEPDILKAYTISRGRVGLMSSMLNTGNHPIIEDIELAKLVLSKPVGDRLAMVDELAKDKAQVKNLIEALESISHAALNQSSSTGKTQASKDWHRRLEVSTKSGVQLTHNPNLKLLLDNLFISI